MDTTTLLSVMHRAMRVSGISRDANCGADDLGNGYVSAGAHDNGRYIIARHDPLNDTYSGVPHVRISMSGGGLRYRRIHVPWDATAGEIEAAFRAA